MEQLLLAPGWGAVMERDDDLPGWLVGVYQYYGDNMFRNSGGAYPLPDG